MEVCKMDIRTKKSEKNILCPELAEALLIMGSLKFTLRHAQADVVFNIPMKQNFI